MAEANMSSPHEKRVIDFEIAVVDACLAVDDLVFIVTATTTHPRYLSLLPTPQGHEKPEKASFQQHRKHSDFCWLLDKLAVSFPQYILLQPPNKVPNAPTFSAYTPQQLRQEFVRFTLRGFGMVEAIALSKPFEEFVTLSSLEFAQVRYTPAAAIPDVAGPLVQQLQTALGNFRRSVTLPSERDEDCRGFSVMADHCLSSSAELTKLGHSAQQMITNQRKKAAPTKSSTELVANLSKSRPIDDMRITFGDTVLNAAGGTWDGYVC